MSKEAMKLALEALELSSVTVDSFGVQGKTREAITALREALAEQPAQHRSTGKQSLQVEHPAWPAPLLQSKQNFERNFGQHWQADWIYSDLAELIDSPPPEQQATTKCWKCGDADPAFTDVCQVPACGMREQP